MMTFCALVTALPCYGALEIVVFDVVYYGKGVRTQEMKIVPIYGGSIFSTKY